MFNNKEKSALITDNSYGIDMGTCNLKIICKNDDSIINVKNTIAIVKKNQIYAYGDEAYAMYEKAPDNIQVCFPIDKGVISHFNNMQALIFEVIEQNTKARLKGCDFVVAVPTDITEVEKRAFFDMFFKSSIHPKNVLLVEKPLAAAVGIGLDISKPTGVMVVDMGADTTEISVISLGGLVISQLLPFGGFRMDDSIVKYLRTQYNLYIGKKSAMQLKESIGCAMPLEGEEMGTAPAVGRDVVSGLPISMDISGQMIYEAIQSDLESICEAIKAILERVPPEVAKDIVASGIYLTGGGSQIKGLPELFNEITNIKINPSVDAQNNVVRGLDVIVSDSRYKDIPFRM